MADKCICHTRDNAPHDKWCGNKVKNANKNPICRECRKKCHHD
jgi:hypothetical protein